MKSCCLTEARRHLKKHGQVARCDECGSLLMAYRHERHYKSVLAELERRGIPYQLGRLDTLYVVARSR